MRNTAGRRAAGTAAHPGDRHPRVWYPNTCMVWEGTELLPPLPGPVWIPALSCSDCFSRPAASRPAQLTCCCRPPLRPLGPRVLRPRAPRGARSLESQRCPERRRALSPIGWLPSSGPWRVGAGTGQEVAMGKGAGRELCPHARRTAELKPEARVTTGQRERA